MTFKFPDGWQLQSVEDSMKAIIDYRGKTPRKTPSGVPLITAKIVKDGRIMPPTEFIAAEGYDSWMNRGLPEPGDVVMTTEAPLGEIGQIDNRKVALGQRLITLRGKPDVLNNTYLKFAMQAAFVQNQLKARSTGTTVLGISQRELRKIEIPFPPLSEQRRIAHILGVLDEKIELNRQMNETLEATARAIFKSWFVDFDPVKAKVEGRKPACTETEIAALFPSAFQDSPLGEIPQGSLVRTLGDLSHRSQYGYTASAKNEIVGPKFLRITDINKKAGIDWSSVPHCEITKKDFDKYRLHKGDVLIARMADPGHGVLIEENQEAVFASYLIRFCPIRSEYARFFQYWLRSDSYWKFVREREIGTTRASLNAKTLSGFPLVIPPLDIVKVFSSQVSSLRDRVVANTSETESLANLRDTLLPKLLSGEIRIDDAAEILEENDGEKS